MNMQVLIIGLKKAEVLLALYNAAKYTGKDASESMKINATTILQDGKIDNVEAELAERNKCVPPNNYFDLVDFGGGMKNLKVLLDGFEFDSSQYDLLHGEGHAQQVINLLQQKNTQVFRNNLTATSLPFFTALHATTGDQTERDAIQREIEQIKQSSGIVSTIKSSP
jgi:predicted enzyme involved in methoxymalonyl-ACP biosynthesis